MSSSVTHPADKWALLERYQSGERSFSDAHMPGVYVPGASLAEIHWERAVLTGANLNNADLQNAHLEEVNLSASSLRGVSTVEMRSTSSADS